jgi:hypothetical protein
MPLCSKSRYEEQVGEIRVDLIHTENVGVSLASQYIGPNLWLSGNSNLYEFLNTSMKNWIQG